MHLVFCTHFQVITTFGPRKPQRQSSNANSSITSDIIDTSSIAGVIQQRSQSPLSIGGGYVGGNGNLIVTPTTSNKVCLETSFTSLQSPSCDQHACGNESSIASSIAGSLFGRSQLSSILQYDVSSITDGPLSDAPTIILADPNIHINSKGKNVAFDISSQHLIPPLQQIPVVASPSPGCIPKSILHRQNSSGFPIKKPTSLSIHAKRAHSDLARKIDLVHDDWYGMAPLASPETLSEISSISSRASLVNNFASSIEKYLQRVTFYGNTNRHPVTHLDSDESADDEIAAADCGSESQMHTPKIMRRTPKISGNLSKCADDWRSVDTYKRMGQVFITNSRVPSDSSGEQSFESASSLGGGQLKFNTTNNGGGSGGGVCGQSTSSQQRSYENSKSADNLDENDSSEILSAAKLTMSDSAILNDSISCTSRCPICPCKFSRNDFCCKQIDHTFCRHNTNKSIQQEVLYNCHRQQQNQTTSSSDTYHSAQSSLTTLEPFSPKSTKNNFRHINVMPNLRVGVLESHFPVYEPIIGNAITIPDNNTMHTSEKSSLLPSSQKQSLSTCNNSGMSTTSPINTSTNKFRINISKKRNGDEDRCFSRRNESLPLLADLSTERKSTTTATTSRYCKRNKKLVYPIMAYRPPVDSSTPTPPISSSSSSITSKGESSV